MVCSWGSGAACCCESANYRRHRFCVFLWVATFFFTFINFRPAKKYSEKQNTQILRETGWKKSPSMGCRRIATVRPEFLTADKVMDPEDYLFCSLKSSMLIVSWNIDVLPRTSCHDRNRKPYALPVPYSSQGWGCSLYIWETNYWDEQAW